MRLMNPSKRDRRITPGIAISAGEGITLARDARKVLQRPLVKAYIDAGILVLDEPKAKAEAKPEKKAETKADK